MTTDRISTVYVTRTRLTHLNSNFGAIFSFAFCCSLFYRKDAERVMDLLVSPMRFLRIDDVEFVAMKACILFNPVNNL